MRNKRIQRIIDYLETWWTNRKLAGIAAGALGIKPMITVKKKGKSSVAGLARNRIKSMKKVVDMTKNYLDEIDAKPGEYDFCIDYDYDYDEAVRFREMIKDLIKERLGIDEIGIYQIGATIGVHTGPYPLGVGIIKKADFKQLKKRMGRWWREADAHNVVKIEYG